jgi:hypothetical protein
MTKFEKSPAGSKHFSLFKSKICTMPRCTGLSLGLKRIFRKEARRIPVFWDVALSVGKAVLTLPRNMLPSSSNV